METFKHFLATVLVVAIVLALAVVVSLALTGCSSTIGYNKQLADLNYKYTRAVIRFADGDMEITVQSWCDYDDSDMIQVISTDGTVYYTHGSNVILICDP
jgi:hypothetical protein